MALRDQPYLPLYVQDFLTDERLMECSASSTGVYIKIMCIMHKSEEYGTILLKQKDKQSTNPVLNFGLKLAKYLPFSSGEINIALNELITEGVLTLDGDKLFQKRMVHDNEVSDKRAEAGREGGLKTQSAKAKKKASVKAKSKANTEYENENENVIKDLYKSVVIFFDENCRPKNDTEIKRWMDTLDKLVRIDGYGPDHIINVTKRARMDDFWRTNFLTINKLRNKNKEGISYFTVFEKKVINGIARGNNEATPERLAAVVFNEFEAGE
jgi:hypothetical protein